MKATRAAWKCFQCIPHFLMGCLRKGRAQRGTFFNTYLIFSRICFFHTGQQGSSIFGPKKAHNLIRPPPRSSLPYRRRIHNLVVHQRRSPLPCRRSILLRRSASLHRFRTAAPGRARGLALPRNSGMPEGPLFYFLFLFSFWAFFSSVFFFVFFETPRLRSQKKRKKTETETKEKEKNKRTLRRVPAGRGGEARGPRSHGGGGFQNLVTSSTIRKHAFSQRTTMHIRRENCLV